MNDGFYSLKPTSPLQNVYLVNSDFLVNYMNIVHMDEADSKKALQDIINSLMADNENEGKKEGFQMHTTVISTTFVDKLKCRVLSVEQHRKEGGQGSNIDYTQYSINNGCLYRLTCIQMLPGLDSEKIDRTVATMQAEQNISAFFDSLKYSSPDKPIPGSKDEYDDAKKNLDNLSLLSG